LEPKNFQRRVFKQNRIFIDRSPKLFEYILEFYRTGDITFPKDPHEVHLLQKEIEFYNLPIENAETDKNIMKCSMVLNEIIHILEKRISTMVETFTTKFEITFQEKTDVTEIPWGCDSPTTGKNSSEIFNREGIRFRLARHYHREIILYLSSRYEHLGLKIVTDKFTNTWDDTKGIKFQCSMVVNVLEEKVKYMSLLRNIL